MKRLFHDHWQSSGRSKVLLRFGRNHLHRGLDRRGVSTLGNFATEVATANGLRSFNVAVFAGGGQVRVAGRLLDWDERPDDPAFAFLASLARFPGTVFDLRPVRSVLHRVAAERRTTTDAGLLYWADSYDSIVYYRTVTPIEP